MVFIIIIICQQVRNKQWQYDANRVGSHSTPKFDRALVVDSRR